MDRNESHQERSTLFLGTKINNARDAFHVMFKLHGFTDKTPTRHYYWGLFLDQNNKIVFHTRIPLCDAVFVLTSFDKIVKEAQILGAVKVIISHNTTTVQERLDNTDLRLTIFFINTCDTLNIDFKDILVISKEGQFYSFFERKSYP